MKTTDIPNQPETREHSQNLTQSNVGNLERAASATVGAAMIVGGLARRNLWGILASLIGASMLYRGISGHCGLYQRLGIDTRSNRDQTGVPEESATEETCTITINRPREDVYNYWRDLRNLPKFIKHLSRVETRGDRVSHWEATGPGGQPLQWDARITRDEPNELIAWESLPGADLQSRGSIRFTPAPGGRGTELKVTLFYRPPFGKLGVLGARFFNQSPEQQLREDLRRLKQLLEVGEIATATAHTT